MLLFAALTLLPPEQQNKLVQHYCAVCHTDAAKSGGLTLEHYDAAQSDPALAAMILSKLRNNAMGAAGIGIPDPPTREAWLAATAAQAEQAESWTVLRRDAVLAASIVRYLTPRVYRLTLSCNSATRAGEIQLTWSPEPQTNWTFSVSGIPQRLEGKGLASAILTVPLPETTLTITGLFPDETVVFPLADLNQADRRQLAVCLRTVAGE